jgi:hypothetical protein
MTIVIVNAGDFPWDSAIFFPAKEIYDKFCRIEVITNSELYIQ